MTLDSLASIGSSGLHIGIIPILGIFFFISFIIVLSLFIYKDSQKQSELFKYYLNKKNSDLQYYYYLQASNLEEFFSPNFVKLFDEEKNFQKFQDLKKVLDEKQFNALQQIKFKKLDLLHHQRTAFEQDNLDFGLGEYFENQINNETIYVINLDNHLKFIECKFEIVNKDANNPVGLVIWFKDVTKTTLSIEAAQKELKQVQEELNLFREVLNNLNIPVWIRDQKDRIFYCNKEYKTIVNLNSNNNNIPELEKNSISVAQKARLQTTQYQEDKYIISQNDRRLFSIFEKPFGNNLLLGFAFDQSEKETIAHEFQEYREAQNNLLEAFSSAIAIYTPDTRLKYFNQSFINLWKLDEKWLFTYPTYAELLEELRNKRVLPEQTNFSAFKKERLKFFTEISETHNEFMYLPDGKCLRIIIIPFASGGLLFAFEDITSHLTLERSINSLNAVQRAILNSLSEGIAVFGQDGKLKLYNMAYLKLFDINEQYAAAAPHIADILESRKDFLDVPEQNWANAKNDLISSLYEREFQKTVIKMNDGRIIYGNIVPLPDGATLITYSETKK